MDESGGLENRWRATSRGFESLPLRQPLDNDTFQGLLSFIGMPVHNDEVETVKEYHLEHGFESVFNRAKLQSYGLVWR